MAMPVSPVYKSEDILPSRIVRLTSNRNSPGRVHLLLLKLNPPRLGVLDGIRLDVQDRLGLVA
jgi:hypothetical protein